MSPLAASFIGALIVPIVSFRNLDAPGSYWAIAALAGAVAGIAANAAISRYSAYLDEWEVQR